MGLDLTAELPADFDLGAVRWARYEGSPNFGYPIDYSIAVVEADVATGRIDFLVRWAPDAYCHQHRHFGRTVAAVIEGEQHLTETRPFETVTKVRQCGFVGPVPEGEAHMERAGPDGLTMLFATHAPDGRLFEVLDDDGNVVVAQTVADFVERNDADAT